MTGARQKKDRRYPKTPQLFVGKKFIERHWRLSLWHITEEKIANSNVNVDTGFSIGETLLQTMVGQSVYE